MPKGKSMPANDYSDPSPTELANALAGLPIELRGIATRQAVPSIVGIIYQAWWSIDAWLRLQNANEVIYLEGAEDFDIVGDQSALTVQVRHTQAPISLNNSKALTALENFWTLVNQEQNRRVDFHYLTTSSVALEQDSAFNGLSGIEAWRIARTDQAMARHVGDYLRSKVNASGLFRRDLESLSPIDLQEKLFRRFSWITDQPDLPTLQNSVTNRITVLLSGMNRSVSLGSAVNNFLQAKFWATIKEPISQRRCLTYGDLVVTVETAITAYIPIPVDELRSLVMAHRPGLGVLLLLKQSIPPAPLPLLHRESLVASVQDSVRNRRAIMLTGTVHKGKTTLAQIVGSTLCPSAWWFTLSDRSNTEVANLLTALAAEIETTDCPELVILDDIDVSANASRVYKDLLLLVMRRAVTTGRGVILTGRGGQVSAFSHDELEILDIPAIDPIEATALCKAQGCPDTLADTWGNIVSTWTGGHPKLVQVRMIEIAERKWPNPNASDLMTPSAAVVAARSLARELLTATQAEHVAEFIYLTSLATVPLRRAATLHLAGSIPAVANPGDLIDTLVGKWMERVVDGRYRVTSILRGATEDVWSTERRRLAHIQLYDAIQDSPVLSPAEAASLVFHAYMAKEPRRLGLTAARLQVINDEAAELEVQRNLLWLPFAALDHEVRLIEDPLASASLRSLQFQVAQALDSDTLPQICERWIEDVSRIGHPEANDVMASVLWFRLGASDNLKIALPHRLAAIKWFSMLPPHQRREHDERAHRVLTDQPANGGLPVEGSTVLLMFACAIWVVKDIPALSALVRWLEDEATSDLQQQFDKALEWPLIQSLGAFVQGAWAANHDATDNWIPWLNAFDIIDGYAKRRSSNRFGWEAAKAKATVLCEHLDQSGDALEALDIAEQSFGRSAILSEQRANVRFQMQDDEAVMALWGSLYDNLTTRRTLDPFAYRRAAISAARLQQWDKAASIFAAAADSIVPGEFVKTQFGLRIDAAHAMLHAGRQLESANRLTEVALLLPAEAREEGDVRWEALQRVMVGIEKQIARSVWKPSDPAVEIAPGTASSPNLTLSTSEPGQSARTDYTKVQIIRTLATLGCVPAEAQAQLLQLRVSSYILARWFAIQAGLAISFESGRPQGVIDGLIDFERTTAALGLRRVSTSILTADDGRSEHSVVHPERWVGMLAAGLAVSPNIESTLKEWIASCLRILGPNAVLAGQLQAALEKCHGPEGGYRALLSNVQEEPIARCAIAAKLLNGSSQVAEIVQLQSFLTSAFVGDASAGCQELFNHHVAVKFAQKLKPATENRFQFENPLTTVPTLVVAIDNAVGGTGTLLALMAAAKNATGQVRGEFMNRLA